MRDSLDDWGRLRPAPEPYQATLEDIRSVFVDGAPFERRRQLIFRALELHAELVWEAIPGARLWINGGFTTLKSWAAPEDADVAVIVPVEDYAKTQQPDMFPMQSLLSARSVQPRGETDKLHGYGGLIDSFFVADLPAQKAVWYHRWTRVSGPDGQVIENQSKGFVEVRRP